MSDENVTSGHGTDQAQLGGPGYCKLTGQFFPERSPGDLCPLCSDLLDELPEDRRYVQPEADRDGSGDDGVKER